MEMEKQIIKVRDKDGSIKDAEVVLYFRMDNKKFIIYTFNEKDDNGMVILYSSLAVREDGIMKFKKIAPEDWTKVKEVMNKIVKEWKE